MQHAAKLQVLQAALMLPLSDREAHLLRTITHHYALGDITAWGASNPHRFDEVKALFDKCSEMLAHVSHTSV